MSRRIGVAVLAGITLTAVHAAPAGASPAQAPAPTRAPAAPADDLGSSLQRSTEVIRTPFEASNGSTWTTFDQWNDFFSDLESRSDRVDVRQVGTSGQGRPISAITIGHPAPPSLKATSKGSVAMLNCSIHGDEPSGREACMSLARDLATTKDPRWLRFLSSTTVVLTDINPDGWVANTRTNAAGVDVNRDFLALKTPEARTLAKLIGEVKPDVLNDLHEYGPRKDYNTQALTLWPRNRNVDGVIHALSKSMVEDYTGARIEASGLTNGVYGQLVRDGKPYSQIAGDGQARILRNYTGLRHVVGQLTEAADGPVTPAEKKDPALLNRRRVAVQYASAVGTAEMVMEKRGEIAAANRAAAARATKAGAAKSGVISFGGQDDMLPTKPEEVEASPMCGYSLTAAQAKDLKEVLDLHGVTRKTTADGAWVPMGQSARGLIPLLLDKRSEHRITEATPVAACPGS